MSRVGTDTCPGNDDLETTGECQHGFSKARTRAAARGMAGFSADLQTYQSAPTKNTALVDTGIYL